MYSRDCSLPRQLRELPHACHTPTAHGSATSATAAAAQLGKQDTTVKLLPDLPPSSFANKLPIFFPSRTQLSHHLKCLWAAPPEDATLPSTSQPSGCSRNNSLQQTALKQGFVFVFFPLGAKDGRQKKLLTQPLHPPKTNLYLGKQET